MDARGPCAMTVRVQDTIKEENEPVRSHYLLIDFSNIWGYSL